MVIKNNKIILNTIPKEKNNQLINFDYFMRNKFMVYLLYLIIFFFFEIQLQHKCIMVQFIVCYWNIR